MESGSYDDSLICLDYNLLAGYNAATPFMDPSNQPDYHSYHASE